jgi:hypothetical protein
VVKRPSNQKGMGLQESGKQSKKRKNIKRKTGKEAYPGLQKEN